MANSVVNASFVDETGETRLVGTLLTAPIQTSGALSTQQLVSTTGAQVSTTRTVDLFTPWTADATNNAATVAIALSPDGTTYTTLGTLSLAAAVNNTGAVTLAFTLKVPAGWYVKLTTSHAALGVSTYW